MEQLILENVLMAYGSEPLKNESMYRKVAEKSGISQSELNEKVQVGDTESYTSGIKRKLRWLQQDLKGKGLLERIGKGTWTLTKEGKFELSKLTSRRYMIAANTELGVIIWGDCRSVFSSSIDKDIQLCVTSPPYMGVKRNYGHIDPSEVKPYCQFIIEVLKPIVARMKPGANLALNLPNDTYLEGQFGRRSTYLERLTLLIEDELSLALMDRVIWDPKNKAPAPNFATKEPYTHLKQSYEFIMWFTNDPSSVSQFARNQDLLTPYTEQYKKLIESGGEKRGRYNSDGNYFIKKGAFSKDNGGALPRNIINIGTTCGYGRSIAPIAKKMGFAPHGAAFPLNLAKHLVSWLSKVGGGFVIDPFGGRLTLAKACEELGRNYITSELHYEYIKPALTQFKDYKGYLVNPEFSAFK